MVNGNAFNLNHDYRLLKCLSLYGRSQLAKGFVGNVGVLLPPATNMVKLNYGCELETSAQQAAKSCRESASLPYGVQENFYLVPKNSAQYRMNATEMAIKNWWSQVRLQSVNIGMAATLKQHHYGTPIMSFIKVDFSFHQVIRVIRSQLAKGLVKKNNGNALPSATNMIKLKYSCKQERTARNVAKACAESSALPYGVQENFHLVAKNLAHSPVEALEMVN
ncbi:unnamed protein product [Heligmosomoides polygyrus]|uniref:SCP domain-containing protein n=1 Tax=Heligmosomoides polygyrus TaxID=6339 RepID=A0A183GB18_HELPZ|nr:unnamed protein product [Heligmosomoides polygyrus]